MSSGTTISMVSNTNGVIDVTKLVGDGGTVDLGGTGVYIPPRSSASITGCTITGGSVSTQVGVFNVYGNMSMASCTLADSNIGFGQLTAISAGAYVSMSDCTIYPAGGTQLLRGLYAVNGARIHLQSCTFSGVSGTLGQICAQYSAKYYVDGCKFDSAVVAGNGEIIFSGTNSVGVITQGIDSGLVTLATGATLDLTGTTYTTPISPGGGVIIQDNVHILYNHTSTGTTLPTSSATEISGGTYGGITNYGVLKGPVTVVNNGSIIGNVSSKPVVDLNRTNMDLFNKTLTLSGLSITNGSGGYGNAFVVYGTTKLTLTDCVIDKNVNGQMMLVNTPNASATINNGYIGVSQNIQLQSAGNLYLNGLVQMRNAVTSSLDGGKVTIGVGAIIDLTSNTNPVVITAATHGIAFLQGGATVYPSAGQASAYMLDNITVPKLRNDNVLDLGGTQVTFSDDAVAIGVTMKNAAPLAGYGIGAFNYYSNAANSDRAVTLSNCVLTSNSTTYGMIWVRGGINGSSGKRIVNITGCTIADNSGGSACILVQSNGVVNLKNSEIYDNGVGVVSGGTVYASGCMFSGGLVTGNGGCISNAIGTVVLSACTITGNTATAGGGYAQRMGCCEMHDCIVSGNSAPSYGTAFNDIYIYRNSEQDSYGSLLLDGGTYGYICGPGDIAIKGRVSVEQISDLSSINAVSVIVSSGAIVDLTGNSLTVPIKAGRGITLYGEDYNHPIKIYGSEGSATQLREFGGGVIVGSAITKIGGITGATITAMPSSCEINFIKSGQTTVSSYNVQTNQIPYVVDTAFGANTTLIRITPD